MWTAIDAIICKVQHIGNRLQLFGLLHAHLTQVTVSQRAIDQLVSHVAISSRLVMHILQGFSVPDHNDLGI